jgi:hypothetical protein
VRLTRSRKPASYRCPLCGERFPALGEHMLIFPEDDHARRRHAHLDCVMRARHAGRMPTRAEWLASQPKAAPGPRAPKAGNRRRERPEAVRDRSWIHEVFDGLRRRMRRAEGRSGS